MSQLLYQYQLLDIAAVLISMSVTGFRVFKSQNLASKRSEPSSRAALMGEQPNPWNVLPLQDATSRHRGAKPPRRCGLLGEISLLSRRTFYPLSDGPSTRDHRITMTDFRLCSTCGSRSQAPLCLYTRRLISDQPEGTFGRLRYSLGGDRPSQTAYQKLSQNQMLVVFG